MDRRVLIVESQSDFALTMASVLKGAGYQTSLAASAADAQRELEKRRPDLVVLRAELPDQSGFVLCGTIRKGKFGPNLPVVLLSSDVGPDALQQHSQTANAAHGYLAIPFEMGELIRLTQTIVPPGNPAPQAQDDVDASLDNALTGKGPLIEPEPPPAAPPPLRATAGGPPRLPRRERRSALTDEDRAFLDRAFASIADRKAELLAESRELRRAQVRRDMLGTPEAKIQILRDELKVREAQIARLSEIWGVRERELLSVEDRLNEKDVEIQGLKMQQDDLTRRLNEAQNTLVEKEREHGRQVEDLLLQKFIGEKEVIEVVSAKEKDINTLRREANARDEELARRAADLESAHKEFESLEKEYGTATLEFEVKEKGLVETVQARDAELASLKTAVEQLNDQVNTLVAARDARYAEYEGQGQALTEELEKTRNERDVTVRGLESQLRLSEEHVQRSDTEISGLTTDLADARARSAEKVGDLEGEIAGLQTRLEALNAEKAEAEQQLSEQLTERAGRVTQLEAELADTIERKDRQEAELQSQIQGKLEQIGELEGEVEASKAALADREAELTAELGELGAQLSEANALLEQRAANIERLELLSQERQEQIDALNARLADRDAKVADLEGALLATQQEVTALQGTVAGRDELVQRLTLSLEETQKALLSTQQVLNDSQANLEAKTEEQTGTAQVLAQTQTELVQVRKERDERMSELSSARNEIQRVTGLWRQTEGAKVSLEEKLSLEIGSLRAQLAEAQGNFEAEQAAHQQLSAESSTQIQTLEYARQELSRGLESTGVDLAATRANLDDVLRALDLEKRAHSDTNTHSEAKITALETELFGTREQAQDLSEQLSATKQELGARVSELTQVNARLAQADDARHHLEERVGAITDESARREELLQNDLAGKSKELADTLRKLTTLQQEKVRQVDVLTREVTARTEQAKTLEGKLKALFDESKRKIDDLGHRITTLNHEAETAKKEAAERAAELHRGAEGQQAALAERDQARAQLAAQQQQANARIHEANTAVTHEKAAAKKAADEGAQRVQRAEARIAQVQQEALGKHQEMETRLKDAQGQLALRQRRVAELEQALEGASATRTREQKELQARVLAADQKANDAAAKLATVAQERKSLDGRHLKDLEDAGLKHKQELERRDGIKAQEVKRLQEAVQEKSKQLKVVELELARYKTKPAGAPGGARPGMARAGSSPVGDAVEEATTKLNPLPEAPGRPQSSTGSRPPGAPAAGTAQRPAAGPARPLGAVPAAAPKRPPAQGEDRTAVLPAPGAQLPPAKTGEEENDFTSLIDNLGD